MLFGLRLFNAGCINTLSNYSLFPLDSKMLCYCVLIYNNVIKISCYVFILAHVSQIHSMPLLMAFKLRSNGILYQLDAFEGK